MRVSTFLVVIFAAGVSLSAFADPPKASQGVAPATPLTFAERHVLASQALGEERYVDVRLPASYRQSAPARSYPVIFVLDGELIFETVAAVADHLAAVGRMPEAVVVGVPNHTGDRLGMSPRFLGRDGKPSGFGGREDQYLQFLEGELVPYLASSFRLADFRLVFGVSPTAAFALHSFWRSPELFQVHVAMVAGGSLDKLYPEAGLLADALVGALEQKPDRRAWLYLSSAESNFRAREEIGTALESFEKRLQPFLAKGLVFQAEVVPGAAYATVLPAVTSALNLIFPPEEWDPRYVSFLDGDAAALANLEAHFDALSARYGFPVVPLGDRFFSVNCLRGLASRLDRQGRSEEALQVLRRWVDLYPSDPRSYLHLAFALEASQPTQALTVGRQGLEVARRTASSDSDRYEDHLRSLEESILSRKSGASAEP
ncbi:MAG: alpha/beta hydrolase-fold protein [Acidobacteriota bacterium]